MTYGPTGTSVVETGHDPFVHEGLFYAGDAEYVAGTVPFLQAALARGEPALVAAPACKLELIGSALGGAADEIWLLDMTVAGRNPGRIIPEVLNAFADKHAGTRVSLIGEPIWPGRTPAEYRAAVWHESLINLAFAGRDATILCPYDAAGLDREALADAERTHPVLVERERRWTSAAYLEPADLLTTLDSELPEPPPNAVGMTFAGTDLKPLRAFVREHAARTGVPATKILELVLAVNEVATNTVTHTLDAAGQLRLWRDADRFVCEIRDSGHITDPLVGRLPAPLDSPHGRGLMIVNHLCDLVELHTAPASTAIRLHVRI